MTINLKSEKTLVSLLLSLHLVFFLVIAIFSEATYDAGDGIRHYLIARYSWGHPFLFLDSWGKPFFTLICSPFAQFGLLGAVFFNILCGTMSAYFAFKICKLLELNFSWIAIPFVFFTTGFFPTLNSGLTEPFFAFILLAAVYAMMSQKYFLGSIIISFLPFIRTEGNLILPLFAIVLLYRKQYLKVLFLGFGTFIYSLIGLFVFKDFFWIKTQNPYNGANRDFYGHGELLHFVKSHNYIWGTILLILFLLGIIAFVISFVEKRKNNIKIKNTLLTEEFLLILGSFAVYFIVHSIMWWKGWANSLGLLRVMAAVLPCTAILGVQGLNLLLIKPIKEKVIIVNFTIAIILIITIRSPFKHEYFPYKLDNEQKLIDEAGQWFKSSPYNQQKVYYLYPYLAHVLNIDSFDPNKVGELWGLYPTIKEWGISAVPDSTVVFWDSHFGPNECRIPLDSIYNDVNFKLIKSFKPAEEFNTLGGNKFEIYVFMKLSKPRSLKELKSSFYNFELNNNFVNENLVTNIKPFSGLRSCAIGTNNEYSVTLKEICKNIPNNATQVIFKAKVWSENFDKLTALAVFSIDDHNKKNIFWDGKKILFEGENLSNGWKSISMKYNLNPLYLKNPENALYYYIWNKDKQTFYLDDFEIVYLGIE